MATVLHSTVTQNSYMFITRLDKCFFFSPRYWSLIFVPAWTVYDSYFEESLPIYLKISSPALNCLDCPTLVLPSESYDPNP